MGLGLGRVLGLGLGVRCVRIRVRVRARVTARFRVRVRVRVRVGVRVRSRVSTCGAEDHGKVAIAHGQRGQVREPVGQLLDERHPPAPGAELVREGEAGPTVPATCGGRCAPSSDGARLPACLFVCGR